MSERKKHIAVLNELLTWMKMGGKFLPKDDPFYRTNEERKEAVKYAISSLETDEAYQLEYEKPEICEDCIPRKLVERIIKSPRSQEQMLTILNIIPSVLPKADKPTIIDWNNCHTSEQLDSISTTKNDFGVDCNNCKNNLHRGDGTSYCATGDGMCHYECEETIKNDLGVDKFDKAINQSDLEEWIMGTFPDWCVGDVRLIMNHMDEMPSVTPIRPKGHWIDHSDDGYVECPKCGSATNCDDNINDLHFCFSCGAELRGSTKRKGNPIEGNNESYNCENWIP